MRDDVARFHRWGPTYEKSLLQRLMFDRVHRVALDELGAAPLAVVVDIGCGTGRLLRAIRQRQPNARLIGVDPAAGMIDEARRLAPQGEFHVAPAEQLPLPDAFADVAITSVSFHHWRDQPAGVREAARILKPGGRFILADILPSPFNRLLGERARTARERDELFAAAGLAPLAHRRVPWTGIWMHVVVSSARR